MFLLLTGAHSTQHSLHRFLLIYTLMAELSSWSDPSEATWDSAPYLKLLHIWLEELGIKLLTLRLVDNPPTSWSQLKEILAPVKRLSLSWVLQSREGRRHLFYFRKLWGHKGTRSRRRTKGRHICPVCVRVCMRAFKCLCLCAWNMWYWTCHWHFVNSRQNSGLH